ncbi:hypothetical protein L0F63_003186, partial [Massospora cicadina]
DSSQLQAIISNPTYEAKATVTLDVKQKAIVLSFRGTANSVNWIENFKFDKARFEFGAVHLGFKNYADALLPDYQLVIGRLVELYPSYSVVITGHSSGGSVAVLASIYLQKGLNLDWNKLQLFTYGQPRVGDAEFATWFNQLPLTTTRVVNENDLVPHIPPYFANYRHQHTELYINKGVPTFCKTTTPEDKLCSNSRVPAVNTISHMSAFDVNLGSDYC